MKMTPEFRQAAMRRGFVPTTPLRQETSENVRYTASLEMANLGFRVSPEALAGMPISDMEQMISDARVVIGADRAMKPIYPGFPNQVQELDTLTLVLEQLLHYWSAGEFLPNYSEVEREGLPLEDMARASRPLEVLDAVDVARTLITSLTLSSIALSEDDKALLTGAVAVADPTPEEVAEVLDSARHGENMQSLALAAAEHYQSTRHPGSYSTSTLLEDFVPTAGTADQLLRLVLGLASKMSGDDNNRFHTEGYDRAVRHLSDKDHRAVSMLTLSRPVRRLILERLGELTQGYRADALVAKRNLWRRVMKMMHPYGINVSDKHQGSVSRALDIIHSNVEYRTFNSEVEAGIANKDVSGVVALLAAHQPGNLLRRAVSLMRVADDIAQINELADAIRAHGAKSSLTTLISAYNGIININDDAARLTRAAGRNNTLVEDKGHAKVSELSVDHTTAAVKDALIEALSAKPAPDAGVGTKSSNPVPLVRRDAATADRVMDRGQRLDPAGDGDTVRIFGHWRNNQNWSGYMDIGAVVLDSDFTALDVVTWDTWTSSREWSTYSGDKMVAPGDSAAEYVDVDIAKLMESHPAARWVAMTIQSWSGFPTVDVDMIAGAMLRSAPDSGEVFDARTVSTAFKPTTSARQSVPLVFDLSTKQLVWIDSSSGSTQSGVSAGADDAVGTVVYHELGRIQLTMGQLAALWARAHNVRTSRTAVDRDAVLGLLED